MSGHSKWSTIKHQKQATDAARGQVFTKIANAITLAVREGGGPNSESNFRLRLVMEKAHSANMPKVNIDRAVERASGKGQGAQILEEVLYEGFGPDGVAILALGVTDNKQRTAAVVKNTFTTHGGTLGGAGSVRHLFNSVGCLHIGKSGVGGDQLLELVLESGAQDMQETSQDYVIYTAPGELNRIKEFFRAKNLPLFSSDLTYKPTSWVEITDMHVMERIYALCQVLEDLEDIHQIYTNAKSAVEMRGQ